MIIFISLMKSLTFLAINLMIWIIVLFGWSLLVYLDWKNPYGKYVYVPPVLFTTCSISNYVVIIKVNSDSSLLHPSAQEYMRQAETNAPFLCRWETIDAICNIRTAIGINVHTAHATLQNIIPECILLHKKFSKHSIKSSMLCPLFWSFLIRMTWNSLESWGIWENWISNVMMNLRYSLTHVLKQLLMLRKSLVLVLIGGGKPLEND